MKNPRITTAIAAVLALTTTVAACSSGGDTVPADQASASAAPSADPSLPVAPAGATPAALNTLTLEGLGSLKLGQPVPARGTWAERGAQTSDQCRVVSSPDYPGVYAIVEGGTVRRITVAGASAVKLVEGLGVGSTRANIDADLPGFAEEPHKYVDGGLYLTAPNAASGDAAVRFELDGDGMVSAMHVGMMPVLGYVEGCA
ncbi:hypothetical protein [Alteraurantiacibacter buctensis]|uniref:Uncharacterized protein n=1 Tax=Alteraurantiacibacter buctensis TaxID=1503981 RepID=A0A844Z360_9SPHN|nr:hypothetical protein [Alteraurantiacibacter buctensis]MXO73124.1 hypothetical protein [Alteraurantiacibacter buctensis]